MYGHLSGSPMASILRIVFSQCHEHRQAREPIYRLTLHMVSYHLTPSHTVFLDKYVAGTTHSFKSVHVIRHVWVCTASARNMRGAIDNDVDMIIQSIFICSCMQFKTLSHVQRVCRRAKLILSEGQQWAQCHLADIHR